MCFVCVKHVTVAVDQGRKCEMNSLRKQSNKIMTKQTQVHVNNMQRYIFTIRKNKGIDYDN